MADSKEKLFSDFSPVSTEKWMEKVTADLKGADFEKKLVWNCLLYTSISAPGSIPG